MRTTRLPPLLRPPTVPLRAHAPSAVGEGRGEGLFSSEPDTIQQNPTPFCPTRQPPLRQSAPNPAKPRQRAPHTKKCKTNPPAKTAVALLIPSPCPSVSAVAPRLPLRATRHDSP